MIGGPTFRQHFVEFIADATTGGVWRDGVRDTSQGTSGPFTWTPPDGVAQIFVSGCAGGGGGGAGLSTGTVRGGGGGGGSGMSVINAPLPVYPGVQLTVTLGSGGNGGVAGGSSATAGGNTTISGLPTNAPWTLAFNAIAGTFQLHKGAAGGVASATNGGNAGRGGDVDSTNYVAGAGTGGTGNQATPTSGTGGTWAGGLVAGIIVVGHGGGGGGGASNSPTTNGALGAHNTSNVPFRFAGSINNGGQDGVNSYGGGGYGASSPFGLGRTGGGNTSGTNQNAVDGLGFGSGGGGGGGSGNGGAGRPGYLTITYWAAD